MAETIIDPRAIRLTQNPKYQKAITEAIQLMPISHAEAARLLKREISVSLRSAYSLIRHIETIS